MLAIPYKDLREGRDQEKPKADSSQKDPKGNASKAGTWPTELNCIAQSYRHRNIQWKQVGNAVHWFDIPSIP